MNNSTPNNNKHNLSNKNIAYNNNNTNNKHKYNNNEQGQLQVTSNNNNIQYTNTNSKSRTQERTEDRTEHRTQERTHGERTQVDLLSEHIFVEPDYSFKNGITFVEFYNLKNSWKEQKWIHGNKMNIFITKGNILRSPNKFIFENVDIKMFPILAKEISKLKIEKGFFIINRISQRKYKIISVNRTKFYYLIELDNYRILMEEIDLRGN